MIPQTPPPVPSGTPSASRKATIGFILGLSGLLLWIIPLVGLPVTIIGLVQSLKGRNSEKHGLATAGVVLSIIGLVLTVANIAIGAYMGATGQHPLVNKIMH